MNEATTKLLDNLKQMLGVHQVSPTVAIDFAYRLGRFDMSLEIGQAGNEHLRNVIEEIREAA